MMHSVDEYTLMKNFALFSKFASFYCVYGRARACNSALPADTPMLFYGSSCVTSQFFFVSNLVLYNGRSVMLNVIKVQEN
jgi:hypothetical protein